MGEGGVLLRTAGYVIFACVFIIFDGPLRRPNTLQIVKDIIVFSFISQPIAISDDQHIWAHIENQIITKLDLILNFALRRRPK